MLTPEQVKKLKDAGYNSVQIKAYDTKKSMSGGEAVLPTKEAPKQGFLSKVASAFTKRADQAATGQGEAIAGNQTKGSALLQTFGATAGFVGDTALEAVKAVTPQPIEDAVSGAVASVASTEPVQNVVTKFKSWAEQHPEAAANLEATVDIASLFPVGAAGAKTASVAGKSAATAAGTALMGTAELGGAAARLTAAGGKRLASSAIRPTVKEGERLLSYEAKNPLLNRIGKVAKGEIIEDVPITRGTTATEKGIMGTQRRIGVQSKRVSEKLYSEKIGPALKQSTDVVSKDDLFAPLIERIEKTTEPGRKKALANAYDAIAEEYQGIDSLSLEDANKLKTELAEFVPDKVYRGQQIANEYKTLKADMASAIRRKTYDSLEDVNIKKDYLDYGNLKELEKVGVKAITEGGQIGGFGGFWTALWDKAAVPMKTIGGQVLYRVGNKLEFTAPKGIKTMGQYLQSKGFKIGQK